MSKFKYFRECGNGWDSIIQPLIELCEKNKVEILQIKEKFAGLRFYVGSAPEEIHDAISKAENLSFMVCEECGEPGKTRNFGGWIKTVCDLCRDKIVKDRNVPVEDGGLQEIDLSFANGKGGK